ncbi:MAG: hypothetical protein JWM21_325 [Acidobacteria bacterium]|nr:hypothetical protein [Acidobacteriota bacterium]
MRNLSLLISPRDASAIPPGCIRYVARSVCRLTVSLALVVIWSSACFAIPLAEYREHVKKAISALEQVNNAELHPPSYREAFIAANVHLAQAVLPRKETVEWRGTNFNVDNSWFDDQLRELEKAAASESQRTPLLNQILGRLQALQERLDEIDKGVTLMSADKGEMRGRLAEILQRAEYARTAREESALSRVLRQLVQWIVKLFPRRRSMSPGGASLVSRLAQIFVLLVALAAIGYAVRMFAPRFMNRRKGKRTTKPEARVVLGERLEPDQSAADLLAEAEALARAGDLRGAIRRGYIALLLELADRKMISLAQHKTNRDYLRAVRDIQRLHQNMEVLTNNFEQHWYGLVPANENDWLAFRAGYKEAVTAT